MMPIKRLVALNQRRLNQTERVLYEMRRQLMAAEAEQAKREEALSAYRIQARERERAINATLFGCIVKREIIYLAKEEIAALKQEEIPLLEALMKAKKAVSDSKEQVETVRRAYLKQGTRTEKYVELATEADVTAMQDIQRKEEMEVEELLMRKNR